MPVTTFCEWTAEPDPVTNKKKQVWFGMVDDEDVPFAFAGVWQPTDEGDRMAFLTCAPNQLVGRIHPKAMPVILAREDYSAWLEGSYDQAVSLARTYSDEAMQIIG